MVDATHVPGDLTATPNNAEKAEWFVQWLQTVVRQHRLVCIGWDKLYWKMQQIKLVPWNAVVADTLVGFGLPDIVPHWNDLLVVYRIHCCGADSRGLYFRTGLCGPNGERDDAQGWLMHLLVSGPQSVGVAMSDLHIDGVKFLGVKNVRPLQMVALAGR